MTQYTMMTDGLHRREGDGMDWEKVPLDEAKALVARLGDGNATPNISIDARGVDADALNHIRETLECAKP